MMVITRIRNIAEHAVVPDANDPLRNTRTTRANFLERLFIAPYYVNYHLEHHLLAGWRSSPVMPPCCGSRLRNPTRTIVPASS
jgi:hypothetical protein